MDTANMVFRSLVLNSDVDRVIRSEATRLGATAGVVFRLFLVTGLEQFQRGAPLPDAVYEQAYPLRAVHIHVHTDENLRVLSYQRNIARDDLVARLLRLGMLTLEEMRSKQRGR